MAKKKKSKSFKIKINEWKIKINKWKMPINDFDIPINECDKKNFKFKTMSAKIKISQEAIDPELLRAMGFNVIIDKSIPKGEIHIKHITVPRDENN